MNPLPITEAEFSALAAQVDAQLATLRAEGDSRFESLSRSPRGTKSKRLSAPEQVAVIEKTSGEPFERFWQRYLRHAKTDLCLPGGVLHDQWQKWKALDSGAAVKVSYGWLAAMGVITSSLAPLAVAATVFLLNAVANIGIAAVCEGCAEEDKARAKALKQHADETFGPHR